jgi:hypothetical protein
MSHAAYLSRRFASVSTYLLSAFLGVTFLPNRSFAEAPTVEQGRQLLQEADRYRGGFQDGGQWEVELDAKEDGGQRTARYTVRAKAANAVVECSSPPKNKGEVILFEDRMLWFYKPTLRRPIGLSPRQRLMGQAANGDLAATNYARDYDVTSVVAEPLKGQPTWRLELKAKAKTVTYDRIRYWIRTSDRLGVAAEFLTLQGEPFKRATFEYANRVRVGGKQLPFVSKMVITSASFSDAVTTITYKNPEVRSIADSIFNVNALMR